MTTDGVLESKDGRQVLRFVRHLDHPIERVWTALTDPDELIGWLAAAEVDLEAGRIVLRWQNEKGPTMDCKITALSPPTLLEYEGEPHGRLRWELRPDGDGTLLTFTAAASGAFPDDQVASALAGWHWHLDALAKHLDGVDADWSSLPDEGWETLLRRYIARLG
jgi:uncharacterized protein YndB with AHSA1/START domain